MLCCSLDVRSFQSSIPSSCSIILPLKKGNYARWRLFFGWARTHCVLYLKKSSLLQGRAEFSSRTCQHHHHINVFYNCKKERVSVHFKFKAMDDTPLLKYLYWGFGALLVLSWIKYQLLLEISLATCGLPQIKAAIFRYLNLMISNNVKQGSL